MAPAAASWNGGREGTPARRAAAAAAPRNHSAPRSPESAPAAPGLVPARALDYRPPPTPAAARRSRNLSPGSLRLGKGVHRRPDPSGAARDNAGLGSQGKALAWGLPAAVALLCSVRGREVQAGGHPEEDALTLAAKSGGFFPMVLIVSKFMGSFSPPCWPDVSQPLPGSLRLSAICWVLATKFHTKAGPITSGKGHPNTET